MPRANSDTVSFPGPDGEPVIVERNEFKPEDPIVIPVRNNDERPEESAHEEAAPLAGEQNPAGMGVKSSEQRDGERSSESTHSSAKTSGGNSRKTGNR